MGALGNIFYCLTNDHRLVNKYALKFMYKPNSLSCTQNSNANGYLNCWDNTKHSWGTTPNLLFAESYANVCPMHTWMVSVANLQCRFYWRVTPRRVLPYLGMVDRFCSDDPHFFFFFLSNWIPILCLISIWLTSYFCRNNQFVSIRFSSRDTWT